MSVVRGGTPTTTTTEINVFIYQVDTAVEGRLIRYGQVQVASDSASPEADGWLGYVRKNGTPPQGNYIVFANGHQYQVVPNETLVVNDLGNAT